ncbi:hypothetical protein VTN00DRAFT_8130 [Thermoascus crustaceus]|uniref:uncharacterized protein n=1 Tax=Thermoascus crustaceus TaxID=5088 RepID=UPI003743DDE1
MELVLRGEERREKVKRGPASFCRRRSPVAPDEGNAEGSKLRKTILPRRATRSKEAGSKKGSHIVVTEVAALDFHDSNRCSPWEKENKKSVREKSPR